jgi:hypothetical protein
VIKRAPRSNHYTVLNTATFSLPMPAECLGVYLYLLSKPDDWDVSVSQLAKQFDCSDARMYRIIKKLLKVEYNGCRLIVKTGQAIKGKKGFAQIEYTVSEPAPKSAFMQNGNTLDNAETKGLSDSNAESASTHDCFMNTLTTQTLNDQQQITVFNKLLSVQNKQAVPAEVYQLGIDPELWLEYMATRKRVKATSTHRAIQTLINKIKKLADAGNNPVDLVEDANANGWKSVYARNAANEPRSARELATNTNW